MIAAQDYCWDELPIFDEDDDDTVYFDFIGTRPNDYDKWLQRYHEIKETNPRFRKYEKYVLDILGRAKDEMNYVLCTERHFFYSDPYEVLNEYNYTLKKRRCGEITAIGYVYNTFCEFQIQCPHCASGRVIAAGSRKGDKKFICRECQRNFYYKQLVNQRYTERKATLAVELIESGCSQNFVAKLFEVSSSTVAKWREMMKPEVINLCYDDLKPALEPGLTQKRLSFVAAFYFCILCILSQRVLDNGCRKVFSRLALIAKRIVEHVGYIFLNLGQSSIFDLMMIFLYTGSLKCLFL